MSLEADEAQCTLAAVKVNNVKSENYKMCVMKKLLVLSLALLLSGALMAQGEEKVNTLKKSFLAFHAGPAFPLDDFAAKTLPADGFFGSGGFAKTGYNLSIRYDYRVTDQFGVVGSLFYNQHSIKSDDFVRAINQEFGDGGDDVDPAQFKLNHWKWYGITAGPALLFDAGKNIIAGLRIMGGVATANSPKASYEGVEVFGEDWSYSGVIQGGADVRIGLSGDLFLFANAEYTWLKPKFEKELTDPFTEEVFIETGRQRMSVVNLTAGIGFRF